MSDPAFHDVGDELDRLCEIASVGAGHAADALADLVGRPIRHAVPRVRMGAVASPGTAEGAWIFFEVHGAIGGALVVRLPQPASAALMDLLVGTHAETGRSASALCELGNILASHALSAVADLIGQEPVLPSTPSLVFEATGPALAAWRSRVNGRICIETPLLDDGGVAHVELVWIPDAPGFAATAPF